MRTIDLRSDTVTLPPPAMREAMARAEVGDDVYGEDPTINRLQGRVAQLLGKEDALFVPSGTMANLIAVLAQTRRGDEVLVGDESHILHYEGGGAAVLGATNLRAVRTLPDGRLDLDALRAAFRDPANVHYPRTGLIAAENTHNRCGGTVLDEAAMAALRQVANEAGVPVHLDGARLFDAAVHLGVPVERLARDADSVYVCFSKGLAAPVGSALAGTRAMVAEARRWRKVLGGGMRQAGILAAGALWALDHGIERLAEDHANARVLAEGLLSIAGVKLAQPEVQTNIVIVDVAGTGLAAKALVARLGAAGVLCNPTGATTVRFVAHLGITVADVAEVVDRARAALEAVPA